MELTVADLVHLVEGRLIQGEPTLTLHGFGALRECDRDGVSFSATNFTKRISRRPRAGAVLSRSGVRNAPEGIALVEVADPVLAFDLLVRRYGAPEIPFLPGIHPTAVIRAGVEF